MTNGEKIAKIRTFRNLTQKELGLAMGFAATTAQTRIAQYETNSKIPKEAVLKDLANALKVHPMNFGLGLDYDSDEYHFQHFFWLEEFSTGRFDLFPLQLELGNSEKKIAKLADDQLWQDEDDYKTTYPTTAIAMRFARHMSIEFDNWYKMKNQLKAGEITQDYYFEWKLQWPMSDETILRTGQRYLDWFLEKGINR